MDAVSLYNVNLGKTESARSLQENGNGLKQHLFKAVEDHLCCNLQGESVIMSLKSGKYYGLNEVGAIIWDLVQKPATAHQISETIQSQYNVDIELCEREVFSFIENMIAEGLIETVYEPNS